MNSFCCCCCCNSSTLQLWIVLHSATLCWHINQTRKVLQRVVKERKRVAKFYWSVRERGSERILIKSSSSSKSGKQINKSTGWLSAFWSLFQKQFLSSVQIDKTFAAFNQAVNIEKKFQQTANSSGSWLPGGGNWPLSRRVAYFATLQRRRRRRCNWWYRKQGKSWLDHQSTVRTVHLTPNLRLLHCKLQLLRDAIASSCDYRLIVCCYDYCAPEIDRDKGELMLSLKMSLLSAQRKKLREKRCRLWRIDSSSSAPITQSKLLVSVQ